MLIWCYASDTQDIYIHVIYIQTLCIRNVWHMFCWSLLSGHCPDKDKRSDLLIYTLLNEAVYNIKSYLDIYVKCCVKTDYDYIDHLCLIIQSYIFIIKFFHCSFESLLLMLWITTQWYDNSYWSYVSLGHHDQDFETPVTITNISGIYDFSLTDLFILYVGPRTLKSYKYCNYLRIILRETWKRTWLLILCC